MKSLKSVTILGVSFVHIKKEDFLEQIVFPAVEKEKSQMIVTANPEIVMHTQYDEQYQNIVNRADYVVPDGIGIIIASKIIGDALPERLPGFEMFEDMLNYANAHNKKVYLLGAKDEVLKKTVRQIELDYPKLKLVGYQNGYIDLNDQQIIDDIENKQPDFIFVALGFPKQEEWIDRHKSTFSKGIIMGVGGSFDVIAGEAKRAPIIWQKLYLEWLYRMIQNPTRFKRFIELPRFLIRVLKERKRSK